MHTSKCLTGCGAGLNQCGISAALILFGMVAIPSLASAVATDPVQLLAELTGSTEADASGALEDLLGTDYSMLLDGLTAGEAEELLELTADLSGLESAQGIENVGVALPAFRVMALHLESRMPDHLWQGQIFLDVTYATEQKRPGQVVGLGGGGDSAIWSGHYLMAQAFRYALAREKRGRSHNFLQDLVWNHEMQRAKERIVDLAGGVHRNCNISKNWKAKGIFTPAFDAEAGILFRNSFPEGVPSWQQYQGPGRHEYTFGPIPWDDRKNYYCQGTFTRDQYSGAVFGLLMTLDLVGPDDPALKAQVAADIMTMTDYLYRHGWATVRPENNVTDPTPMVGPLANGISWDLFMAQAARHAAHSAGTLEDQVRFDAIWATTFANYAPLLPGSQGNLFNTPSTGYYGFNLAHGQVYNNVRLEPDPAIRTFFRECFSQIDSTTKDDGNAHFETITYALTGEGNRLELAVQHLEEWLDYYARWSEPITMSTRCGIDLECIPEDQVTYETRQPDGTWAVTATQPGRATRKRSARVLRIADERTSQDFLWQRSPYQGSGELDNGPRYHERNAGVDFLLPYYMLRYYTEVETPAYDPWFEYPVRAR